MMLDMEYRHHNGADVIFWLDTNAITAAHKKALEIIDFSIHDHVTFLF